MLLMSRRQLERYIAGGRLSCQNRDNPMPKLTKTIIEAAILGFEAQKHRIDAEILELRAMLPGARTEPEPEPTAKRRRRKMSAAGRRAIAEAQRKRWAAVKPETKAPKISRPKRKLSPAGKAAIVAALKKRWAAKRAEAAKN